MADATVLEVPTPDGGTRDVRVSSPARVLWPDSGITKLELAEYAVSVGPALLAALRARPVTLQRFPTGIEGEEFYSKNPPRGVPAWTRTVVVTYPSGRRHPQLVVDEVATAVWAIQMNTITFHPWPVSVGSGAGGGDRDGGGGGGSGADDALDHPDEVRIDLDPQPGRPFADVVEAAVVLRELMSELGLTAWVKTSGNRGLHVYSRIAPEREFLDVRHGVIGIARELERRLPELVTTAWWKEERGDKVFVDFNQANRDRTIASAWSPRPLPGAPVSTPLAWSEVREVTSAEFTVRSVPARYAADGDPWQGIGDAVGDFSAAMALWDADVARGLPEKNFPPDFPKMAGEPPRVQPSRKNEANWAGES